MTDPSSAPVVRSLREALTLRNRAQQLAVRLSVIVGALRVFFAVVFITLATWQFPNVSHQWPFYAYLAAALVALGMIQRGIMTRERRSLLFGIADVAISVYLCHLVGTFSFMALGCGMIGVLFSVSVGPRVAFILACASALAYLGVVVTEGAGILAYGPAAPAWMHGGAAPGAAIGLACIIVMTGFVITAAVNRVVSSLAEERTVSEALLLNVLPASIAERLKASLRPIAERLEDASVMFADVVGFTPLSARLPPEEVVEMLNGLFSTFDALAARHGIEKIKTIGDAYMAAGGVPHVSTRHASDIGRMALDMLDAVRRMNVLKGTDLNLRIGLHVGPVVAGVIGQHRFTYDLWGDTVNVASRMESHGEAGRIHVSAAFRDRVAADFEFEDRGVVKIKGRGELPTYFLLGLKPG